MYEGNLVLDLNAHIYTCYQSGVAVFDWCYLRNHIFTSLMKDFDMRKGDTLPKSRNLFLSILMSDI